MKWSWILHIRSKFVSKLNKIAAAFNLNYDEHDGNSATEVDSLAVALFTM